VGYACSVAQIAFSTSSSPKHLHSFLKLRHVFAAQERAYNSPELRLLSVPIIFSFPNIFSVYYRKAFQTLGKLLIIAFSDSNLVVFVVGARYSHSLFHT
jgi:hypothetical protein